MPNPAAVNSMTELGSGTTVITPVVYRSLESQISPPGNNGRSTESNDPVIGPKEVYSNWNCSPIVGKKPLGIVTSKLPPSIERPKGAPPGKFRASDPGDILELS